MFVLQLSISKVVKAACHACSMSGWEDSLKRQLAAVTNNESMRSGRVAGVKMKCSSFLNQLFSLLVRKLQLHSGTSRVAPSGVGMREGGVGGVALSSLFSYP